MRTYWQKNNFSLSLQTLMPNFFAGLVISILSVCLSVSFAALIFSGELSSFVPGGIGFMLFGSVVFSLILALFSSFVNSVAIPQDSPAAIMAVMAIAIAGNPVLKTTEERIATVVAALIVSTTLTGLLLWLMGKFNLGHLVRFLPYPVVGGFLAGTGWLLISGGISVMVDQPLSMELLQPEISIRWIPGLLFGIIIYVVSRRFTHFLLMPGLLILGVSLFYIIFSLSAGSLAVAGQDGWLLGPFSHNDLWRPSNLSVVLHANWTVIFSKVIHIVTIVMVSSISLLLNASGLELTSDGEVDFNTELKVTGIANILAGLGGSSVGFPSLSLSSLGYRLAGRSRMAGIFAALLIALVLFLGTTIISFFPKMISGAYLVFLGLSFMVEWVYDGWFKLPKLDYFLVWVIVLSISLIGFLEGVAIGIAAAIFLFVNKYRQIKVVRHAITGKHYQSCVVRPPLYQQLLKKNGHLISIFELQGFIFFGTASQLSEQIHAMFESKASRKIKYLLLDFYLVTGVDSSALLSFSKIQRFLAQHEVQLVFTNLPEVFQKRWQRDFLETDQKLNLHIFESLDLGLAWCEDQIIHNYTAMGLVAKFKTMAQSIEDILTRNAAEISPVDWIDPRVSPEESRHFVRLTNFLERRDIQPGEVLLEMGQKVDGLYFVEAGQALAQIRVETKSPLVVRVLTPGTVFGDIGIYTQQTATADIVVSEPGYIYFLSAQNLAKAEEEDPELAIAFHRYIAGGLGEKLAHSSELVRVLRG
jgi:sulfate permease, SulP family